MRGVCVRHHVAQTMLATSTSSRLILTFGLIAILGSAQLTAHAAPIIRIAGPDAGAAGKELVLRAEPVNESARELMEAGAFFEWWIGGTPRATGTIFRCRSDDPADYVVELHLRQRVGAHVVTLGVDRRKVSFLAAQPKPEAISLPDLDRPRAESAPPGSARWILKSQRTSSETNVVPGAYQRLVVGSNECYGMTSRREIGTIEARVRWPPLPATLTPGNQLIFDLQQEMRLTPSADADPSSPLSATVHARFFALSEFKHERTVDSLSDTVAGRTNRTTKTKRIQWTIPTGRLGDTLSLELGSQSPAGTASRFYIYRLESAQPALTALPPAALQVALYAERTNIPVGAAARVKAETRNGIPPLDYRWTIDGLAQPERGETLVVSVARPGYTRVAVEVMDARKQSASAELTLEGIAPGVRLYKDAPAGYSVFIGEPISLRAEMIGMSPIPPQQLYFRWTGAETTFFDATETAVASNRARCFATGTATVHVELVYRPSPAVAEVLARSEPITFSVSAPSVSLVFDPTEPLVGQEITASVRTDPPVGGVECRWVELPTNAIILARSADCRELKFVLRDTRPAFFKTVVVMPRLGLPIAEGSGHITAARHIVNISGPSAAGSRPRVWREGVGFVTLENEWVVGEPLRFTATLVPSNPVVRWTWMSPSPLCQIQMDSPTSAKVICGETGRYEIVVRAFDSRDIELGAARKIFGVSVPAEALAESQRRHEAQSWREKGYAALQAGQVPQALAAYRQSYSLHPTEELNRHIEQLERQLSREAEAAEQALALRREEEKRQAEAERLKKTGWEHIRARRYDEGLEALRRSLALKPDAELEAEVQQIRDAVEKRRARQAEAARLRREAEIHEGAGRLHIALKSYRASLAAWQDEAVERRVAQLEKKLAEQEAATAKANSHIADGERLEQAGDWEGALAAYQKALVLRADSALSARIGRLQERQRQKRADRETADRLRNEAEALLQAGRAEDALLKYRESLRLWPDEAVAAQARDLEDQLARERETREKAARLRDEAVALALAGQLDEALAKYRESVALQPNAELEQRIKDLEAEVQRRQAEQEKIARLAADAKRLESEQKWDAALAAYRQLLALRPDAETARRVARIEEQQRQSEAQRKNARKLAADADALAAKGALEDALLKYRESLRLWPDDEVAQRARALENTLAENKSKRERALELRDEAAALVLAGQLESALAKYRESTNLQTNAEAEQRIRDLEAEMAKRRAIREEADRLVSEAGRQELEQRWDEALSAYRKALALGADTNIQTRIEAIEAKRNAEKERRLQAASLREKAAAAAAAGRFENAVELYRQSLELEPNDGAQQQIAALEQQLEAKKSALARSEKLFQEGIAFEQEGRWEEAVAKFRAALILAEHKEARKHLVAAQREATRLAREKEKADHAAKLKEATARKLREEGLALQQKGQLSDAAARFRASLDLVPNPELEQLLREIEQAAASMAEREAKAQSLAEEAREHALAGRFDEAIRKYQESLVLRPSPAIEDALGRVKKDRDKKLADLKKAADLRQQAAILEKDGKLAEAAATLRQSLTYESDPETRAHAARLEARVRERIVAQKAHEAALEKRKQSAQRLWDEANDLEKQGRTEDALLKLRAGLEMWPDEAVKARVEAIQAEIIAQKSRQEKARALEQEAAALEKGGNLEAALNKYRESMAVWSNTVVEQHIGVLEQQVQAQHQKKQEAARFDEQGRQALEAGRFDEAITAFERSLALFADAAVQKRLTDAQKQREEALRRHADYEAAMEKARLAESRGQLEAALAHAKTALALQPDNEDARRLAEKLQAALAQQEKALREAQAKAREAYELEVKGDWEAALAAYQSSLAQVDDAQVRQRFDKLQQRMADREKRKSEAARLRDTAHALVQQNKLDAALAKYKESLALWPDKQLEHHVSQLEAKIKRAAEDRALAQRLRKEGEQLERDGRKQEAITKYQESLSLLPDSTVQALITHLQSELERERATRETADKLWSEGMIRFRSGKAAEGLVLLKQSIQISPDLQRAEALRQMEEWAMAKKTASIPRTSPTAAMSAPVAPSPQPAVSTSTARSAPALAKPDASPKKTADMAGSRWKGVVLFRQGDDWQQWPLIVQVGDGYNISGSFEEQDARAGRPVAYSVSGVWDPSKKVWYMACLRSDGHVTQKATLTGQLQTDESAGGTVSILLGGDAGREPIKGTWRLLRQL